MLHCSLVASGAKSRWLKWLLARTDYTALRYFTDLGHVTDVGILKWLQKIHGISICPIKYGR